MTRRISLIHILAISLSFYSLNAQDYTGIRQELKFRHITLDNGLSNNFINSICEDNNGYLWVATRNGLNRLSSTETRTYFQDQNKEYSILSDFINVVFSDSRGFIWIGTENGIGKYHEGYDRFIPFEKQGIKHAKNIYSIIEDKKQNIWFGTDGGLFYYDLKNDSVLLFDAKTNGFPTDTIYDLVSDTNNSLWISFYDNGVGVFSKETNKLKTFRHNPKDISSISGNDIEKIYKDRSGNLWFGSLNTGLNLFNKEDSSFIRYTIDSKNRYSNRVRTIFENPEGDLFLGTRAGIYYYDPLNFEFKLFAHASHEFSKLSKSSVQCSYVDRNKGLWIGTTYGGVNYANLAAKPFISYTAKENNNYYLNNSSVFGMDEDAEGNLYIGTEGGVNILDAKTSTFSYLKNDPGNKNSLSYNDVKSIAVLSNGDLWIATNLGGLNYYSKKEKKYTVFKNIPGDPTSLPDDKVYFIYLDKEENLWVITNPDRDNYPSSLSLLRKGSRSFKTFQGDFYSSIIEDSQGNMYIGSIHGFYKYEKKGERFTLYKNDSLIGENVWCLLKDENNRMWIGSNRGLTLYDFVSDEFISYSDKLVQPTRHVYGILNDNSDNLWISTNAGLYKYIGALVKNKDSVAVRLFNKDDGLPSKEFMYNSSFKNSKGELFFGGINGFIRFNPDQIKDNTTRPNIVLSELIIDGQFIKQGDVVEGDVILKESLNNTNQITLNHRTKSIIIKFDALHFANPERNSFKYILENFDEDWQAANVFNNTAVYTSLNPGKYRFKVFAINNDGLPSSEQKIVDIEIPPPVWDTLLFKFIVTVAILLLIFFAYRTRIKIYKVKQEVLEEAVRERTLELDASNRELKEQKYEILTQNEEIQSQNEELVTQREHIDQNNELLKTANENLKYVNDFGEKLTSKLNISEIQKIIETFVTKRMDIDIICLGLLNETKDSIKFNSFSERGTLLPEFASRVDDTTSIAAYCIRNNNIVVCNDLEKEYSKYISEIKIRSNKQPESVVYFPIAVGEKVLGLLTLQSYKKNAFTNETIELLKSILSYITIALDNALAYEIVQNQKEEISAHQQYLEKIVDERTKKLVLAKNKAEESDKLKTAFLANMSHEIRTPLNAIIGFVDILEEPDMEPEQVANFYRIIKQSGYTLLQLINDIIDISKIESGQLEIYKENVNIHDLLDGIYNTFNEKIKLESKTKKIKLRLSDIYSNGIKIETDQLRLQQIFNNLLSNAIKFTPEGVVEFGVKNITEQRIEFYVKDTGIGIDRKFHDVIFERFRKLEEDKKVLYGGTGLGLAITKNLIEKLGGELALESEINKGTEISFTLPLEKNLSEALVEDIKSQTKSTLPDWKDKTILLAEDEETNFMVINSILAKTNVKILYARDGQEAVDLFNANKNSIDLILLDIKMPKKNGFEVLEEIRSIKSDIVVIAQTAYALADEQIKIRNAGFTDYISKPITKKSLFDILVTYFS